MADADPSLTIQELFAEIDQEKDGEIYLKEVVLYLRAMNEHLESLEVKPFCVNVNDIFFEPFQVKHLLDQYELRGMETLDYVGCVENKHDNNYNLLFRFVEIMTQLEAVGWVRVQRKESDELTELDIDEIFKMIDVDKSGSISRSVS